MRTKQEGSGLWKHGLMLTMLFGFTVMLIGGAYIYKTRAPIPERVVDTSGRTLFTAADIQNGQELFRKRNLMNYGSVLGHGAYLGPDYTAEALHWMTDAMRAQRSANQYETLGVGQKAGIDAEIAAELKQNRYEPDSGVLTFTRRPGARVGFRGSSLHRSVYGGQAGTIVTAEFAAAAGGRRRR